MRFQPQAVATVFCVLLATTRASGQMVATNNVAVSGGNFTLVTDSTQREDRAKLVRPGNAYWRRFAAGFAASIMLHEAGHIGSSIAFGGRPSFGLDKARPTVFANMPATASMRQHFVFSSIGLTMQSLVDELILDVPHHRGAAFERGILAGGIGTTLFYVTAGRTGRVSDVQTMSLASGLSKTQISAIYGSVAAMHMIRIARNGRYANFFARPTAEGTLRIGMDVK